MKSFFAFFHMPGKTEPLESTVLIFDKTLSIGFRNEDGSNSTFNWLLRDIKSNFETGSERTRIKNSKYPGNELLIESKDADNYIREMQAEMGKPWYQKSSGKEWIRNSLLLLGIAGLLFLVYLLIVPWLSSSLASKVSVKTEKDLGDMVYNAMELSGREDTSASYVLNEFFNEMNIHSDYPIKITVIKDNTVNAFALPGGRIVVYNTLLKEVGSYPELAALLCHEFIHINNKHTTKSIFRRLGSKVFLGLLFGRFGTVSAVLVDHADNLKSLKYSRRLEKEADIEGLALLAERKIDAKGFSDLFQHLKETATGNSMPEFLGSHPDIGKRISYINKASAGLVASEDLRLKTIFEKLKQ